MEKHQNTHDIILSTHRHSLTLQELMCLDAKLKMIISFHTKFGFQQFQI